MYNNVEQIMTGKRKPPIGFRLYDDEEERLNTLLAEVKQRNRSMDRSKLLREAIGFDPRNTLTDEDLNYLRTGKRDQALVVPAYGLQDEKAKPQPVYRVHATKPVGPIAEKFCVSVDYVMDVVEGKIEGKEPHLVKHIQEALKTNPDDINNVSPIKRVNGR